MVGFGGPLLQEPPENPTPTEPPKVTSGKSWNSNYEDWFVAEAYAKKPVWKRGRNWSKHWNEWVSWLMQNNCHEKPVHCFWEMHWFHYFTTFHYYKSILYHHIQFLLEHPYLFETPKTVAVAPWRTLRMFHPYMCRDIPPNRLLGFIIRDFTKDVPLILGLQQRWKKFPQRHSNGNSV